MSHVGHVRSNNEDSFAERPDLGLYTVADGMGGAQAGERASRITVDTVVSHVQQAGPDGGLEQLEAAVVQANDKVREEARRRPELRGMGTTVVAALIREPKAYLANVGDSRIYRRSGGKVDLVTSDHSWVNDVGRGLGLSDEQLKTHPYRNVLTKAIGAEEEVQAQGHEIDFLPGDLLMLCSDGLHGVLSDDEVAKALLSDLSLQKICEKLVYAVLDHGAPDNVTLVLIECVAESA
jgi:protein phosphatase